MKKFNLPPDATPAEKALAYMVEHHEAFPRTVKIDSETTVHFYKIFTE